MAPTILHDLLHSAGRGRWEVFSGISAISTLPPTSLATNTTIENFTNLNALDLMFPEIKKNVKITAGEFIIGIIKIKKIMISI